MTKQEQITHIIINTQVLQDRINNGIAERYFSHTLKKKAKIFVDELVAVEKQWYDDFFNKEEDSTVFVYDVYDKFISDVSSIAIHDMKNVSLIIEAYKKDPKSIEGICRKILK